MIDLAKRSSRDVLLAFAVIAAMVVLLYGQTLHVPFYLDDNPALIDNYLLRDLSASFERLFSRRGLTNLTFALNFYFTGWDLLPLHLTNIALHVLCGFLVWLLLLKLTQQPGLSLLGALLFVAHPLQTQAVTYLVQRATVLAAIFSLLAFYLFLRARAELAGGHKRTSAVYLRPYIGAILAGACAVLSKENTATLPLLLVGYGRIFPLPVERGFRRALFDYLPFFVAPCVLGVTVMSNLADSGDARGFYAPLASMQHNSPLNYLVTQFSVIWLYLRMLIAPFGQAFEHDYPVVNELITPQSCVALAGLLFLGWLAWEWRRRHPLAAFSIVWFFLTLAVESSVFPLDPLFEHRLYLPMFGFVLLMVDRLPALLDRRWVYVVLVTALAVWGPLTWRRNVLWNDPIAFYEDNLKVVPTSERAIKELASSYRKAQRFTEGLRLLEKGVQDNPEQYSLYGDLAKFYVLHKEAEKGLMLLETGMYRHPENAEFYEVAANICKNRGDSDRAIGYLLRGLAAKDADRGRLLNALGVYYSDFGMGEQAEKVLLECLKMPASERKRAVAYLNLSREYYYQERWPEAMTALREALRLSPGDPIALEKLGEVALQMGDISVCRWAATKLKVADPQAWQRLQLAMKTTGRG